LFVRFISIDEGSEADFPHRDIQEERARYGNTEKQERIESLTKNKISYAKQRSIDHDDPERPTGKENAEVIVPRNVR
jgi:hypothetical protein